MPIEVAEGVLQVLSKRFEGSNLCDLLNSQIYTKYGLMPEELSSLSSSWSHSCTPEPEEESKSAASFSEEEAESCKANTEPSKAEAEPAGAKTESPKAQSDSQLFSQLLVTEGMALSPETQEAAAGELSSGRGRQGHSNKTCIGPDEVGGVEENRGGRALAWQKSLESTHVSAPGRDYT